MNIMTLTARYLVVKSAFLLLEDKGIGEEIAATYRDFANGKKIRYLPSRLGKIPVEVGQLVTVTYGDQQTLSLGLKLYQCVYSFPKDPNPRNPWRTISSCPMTIEVDGQTYQGENIAYDQGYAGLSTEMWSLRALNEEAKKIGGSQLEHS